SVIGNSCHQIEKVPIVKQVRQFAKSTPLTSAHNIRRKRQYRESGFVLVPPTCQTCLKSKVGFGLPR
ncbi:hypothetical protein, partial [Yoonia sp. R2-816]|uniref:hypothetical protein n=1 Tax=Yoonia sp. R2-816 TaxID=3342638 RepID=UPI00372C694F